MWGLGMCPLDGWSLAFDIPNGLGLQVVLFGAGLPCAVLLRVVSDCGSLVEASSSHCDHSFGLVNGVPFLEHGGVFFAAEVSTYVFIIVKVSVKNILMSVVFVGPLIGARVQG